MIPGKEAAQAATGLTLVVEGNGTEYGLYYLLKGWTDVSMASEPLAEALANLKKEAPNVHVPDDVRGHIITKDTIAVIAHPRNPATSLSGTQVKALMTGAIKSWKEVGGNFPHVTVIMGNPGSGTKKVFQKLAMDDQAYAEDAISAAETPDVIKRVSETPDAVAAVSVNMASEAARAGKVKVIETPAYSRPLLFVTVGNPNRKIQKVIDFFQGPGQALIK